MDRALAFYFKKHYPNLSYQEAYFQAEQLEENLVMKYGTDGLIKRDEFWNVYVSVKDKIVCGNNRITSRDSSTGGRGYVALYSVAIGPNDSSCV